MKFCVIGQVVTSYVYILLLAAGFVFGGYLMSFWPLILLAALLFSIAFSVGNIICAVKSVKTFDNDNGKIRVLSAATRIKLLTIPMFCFNLFLCAALTFVIVFVFPIFIILLIILMDYVVLLSSSAYSIVLLIRNAKMTKHHKVLLIISQFLFVFDIVGLLIFRKLAKGEPND